MMWESSSKKWVRGDTGAWVALDALTALHVAEYLPEGNVATVAEWHVLACMNSGVTVVLKNDCTSRDEAQRWADEWIAQACAP